MRLIEQKRGFTLVELMVVVGIITLLATIILASVSMARENTREKKRVSDLANIEFALTLYREKERNYPDYDAGVPIGEGGAIDDIIELYSGNAYADPRASDAGYAYWYDSDFTCYGSSEVVIYAATMEQAKNANYEELCTNASPDTTNDAGVGSYVVILKQ